MQLAVSPVLHAAAAPATSGLETGSAAAPFLSLPREVWLCCRLDSPEVSVTGGQGRFYACVQAQCPPSQLSRVRGPSILVNGFTAQIYTRGTLSKWVPTGEVAVRLQVSIL